MTFLAGQLLARLAGAGIGAVAKAVGIGAQPAQASAQNAQGADFATLLKQANQGVVASGKPVNISAQVGAEFSPEQLQRLSFAADRAAAGGLNHALVIMDGQAFELDVSSRTITGRFDPSQTRAQTYDGVIAAPGENDAQPTPMLGTPPANIAANPQLTALLDKLARQSRTTSAASPTTGQTVAARAAQSAA